MQKLRISTAVIPPGGWMYPEAGATVEGASYQSLVTNLTNFRIANQMPLGNPEEDIQSYICQKFPGNCFEGPASSAPVQRTPKIFRDRIQSWAANRYADAGSYKLVLDEEANRRAAICVDCPNNKQWRGGCPPCDAAIDRSLIMIRQNRQPSVANLGGCAIAGHDNPTACMLPVEQLAHAKKYRNELPEACWLR